MSKLAYKNVSIKSFKDAEKLRKFSKILKNLKTSIEILKVAEFQRISIKEFVDFFDDVSNLRILILNKCKIAEEVDNQMVNSLSCLEEIHFEKCDGNCFKFFKGKSSIKKVLVRNDDWTWNGFSHDDFNDLVKTLDKLDCIVLDGAGTGSYFDCDYFPYKIRKLETSLITFHWYVGIKTERVGFLHDQKGFLKELKIQKLPYDFDGGNVLRFIIESMDLETFYYDDIPCAGYHEAHETTPIIFHLYVDKKPSRIKILMSPQLYQNKQLLIELTFNICEGNFPQKSLKRLLGCKPEKLSSIKINIWSVFEIFKQLAYKLKISFIFLFLKYCLIWSTHSTKRMENSFP